MLDIAADALALGPAARSVALARAVRLQGFGSRRPDQAALFDASGPTAGTLLGGVADDRLALVAARGGACETVEVTIGDDPAVQAGLACGGSASVVVQDVRLVPPAWWEALLAREPVALVTNLPTGRSRVVTRDGSLERLERGQVGASIEGDELTEVWWPTPRLHVLGAADLAGALMKQAAVLGWEGSTSPGGSGGPDSLGPGSLGPGSLGPGSLGPGSLGPADALVVLTHDHDLATPALAAALTGRAGFVGALGSRHTQAERRQRLAAAGVEPAALERLHGPVGLNLGARSPEEQALAICAEIVAVRSGRVPGSLRDATGPING